MSQPPDVRIEMNRLNNAAPAPEPPHEQRQLEQSYFAGLKKNDNNVFLIVATLITTLTYQLGTNLPRGYYQDDNNGHRAGDSILRDKDPHHYWLFIAASWTGFIDSMFMTLALLTGFRTESCYIRYSFMAAYSSLVLTFITSLPGTSILYDILLWLFFLFFLWTAIKFKRWAETHQEAPSALKKFVRWLFRR